MCILNSLFVLKNVKTEKDKLYSLYFYTVLILEVGSDCKSELTGFLVFTFVSMQYFIEHKICVYQT